MRKLLLILLSTVSVCSLQAQTAVKSILASMPEEIVPYLNAEQRAELSRFTDTSDSLTVKNSLNGTTYIDSISDTYVRIKLSKMSDIQIKLLPLNDSVDIICTVKTVSEPVADSSVRFYSAEWGRLHDTFGVPDQNDPELMVSLLTARPDTMSTSRYDELCRMLEPVIVSATFAGGEDMLTYSLSLPLLNKSERDDIKAVTKQKSFKWGEGRFNKI